MVPADTHGGWAAPARGGIVGRMTSTTRRGAVIAAILAGALAAPAAAAAAPSLSLDRECYTPGMPILHTGDGYTPGGAVRFFSFWDGRYDVYETTADASGAVRYRIGAPSLDARHTRLSVTANDVTLLDQNAPPEQVVAVADTELSQWEVSVASWDVRGPIRARPGRRTTVRAIGWVGGASTTLYAHYLRKGRHVATVKVGELTGACGDLSARMREFPFRRARPGSYTVRFDTSRVFPNDDSWIRYRRVVVGRR